MKVNNAKMYHQISENIIGNWLNEKQKLAFSFKEDNTCLFTTKVDVLQYYSRFEIINGTYSKNLQSEINIKFMNESHMFLNYYSQEKKTITLYINSISDSILNINIIDSNNQLNNVILKKTEKYYGEQCIYKWYDKYLTKNFSSKLINTINFLFVGLLLLSIALVPLLIILLIIKLF